MNLKGDELTKFLEGTAEKFKEDTEFLLEQGWQCTDEKSINGEEVFSVWLSPDGKKYAHQNELFGGNWIAAIDRAESDFIVKQGFKVFDLYSTCPELSDEFNLRRSNTDSVWKVCSMLIHPKSNLVYGYSEAVYLARYYDMNDPNKISPKTQQIQEIIAENKLPISENSSLYVEFVKEDKKNYFYRFRCFDGT